MSANPVPAATSASPTMTVTSVAGPSKASFTPSGVPPYAPPPDVLYPSLATSNAAHISDMTSQPVMSNLPPHTLFRPAWLPADMDRQFDQASVWMGVASTGEFHSFIHPFASPYLIRKRILAIDAEGLGRAVYFVPSSCGVCAAPNAGRSCDRGFPRCGQCRQRGIECKPSDKWASVKRSTAASTSAPIYPRSDPHHLSNGATSTSASTPIGISSSHKGKERASQEAASNTALRINDSSPDNGRGKRVKKKRRLSATGEIDPSEVPLNGTIRKSRPSVPRAPPPPRPTLSASERAYNERVRLNKLKPVLKDMRGGYPMWARTRRSLMTMAEYLRNPIRTDGASVDIGHGEIARGVILEGEAPGRPGFWSQDKWAGTIVASMSVISYLQSLLIHTAGSRDAAPYPILHRKGRRRPLRP